MNGYNYTATLPYLPSSNSWIYNNGNSHNYYANNLSGAQQLSNGNVIMCNGQAGTFSEVTSSGTLVWKYINPVNINGIATQGSNPGQNIVFRCPFYANNYSGFSGHNLTPGTTIENSNTATNACVLILGIENKPGEENIKIFPNPASNFISISGISRETKIFNSQGSLMWDGKIFETHEINTSAYPCGVYFVRNNNTFTKFVVLR